MDLVAILSRHEGKTLEFKRDFSSPQGVLRTAVAFANTAGGKIVLGVEDRTRKVSGISDVLTLEVMPWSKTQVVVIDTTPAPTALII